MSSYELSAGGSAASSTARNADLTGVLSVMLAVVGCGLFALSMPAVPDHGYQFFLAREILGGAKLYVDVAAADMHPPLFTWFAASIEIIARAFGTTGLRIYPFVVIALTSGSLWTLWRLGLRSSFVLMAVAVALLPMAGPYLGQGEHLALICSLPYLAASAIAPEAMARRPFTRVLIAIAAAFGLAMKPYFALVWIGTELYLAQQHGRRSLLRIENFIIAICFTGYVVATALITPEFFRLLPWLMQLYPRFAHAPLSAILVDRRMLLLIVALVIVRIFKIGPEWYRLADVLSIAALAMFVAVLLQGKDWGYHWYPVTALSVVMIGLTLRQFGERLRLVTVIIGVVAVLWMNRQVDRTAALLAAPPAYLGQLIEVVEKRAQGGPIVALADNIHAGFPLVSYTGVGWASPYAHLWMIPAMYRDSWYRGAPWRYRSAGKWQGLEQQMFDGLWTAIDRKKPTLMLLQVPLDNGFNTMDYFATDPRFEALFRRSIQLETVGHYRIIGLRY